MPKISVGRSDEDFEEHGLKGTGVIGKHLVGENEEAHKANPIHFDLAKPHVMGVFGKRGTGKCLLPDEKVLTETGLKEIREIFNQRENDSTEIDDDGEQLFRFEGGTVQSVNEHKISKNRIEAGYRKKVDETLFKLKTRSGRKITVTGEHPLLTVNGWENTDRLSEGEKIGIPRKIDLDFKDSELSVPKAFQKANYSSLNRREARLLEHESTEIPSASDGSGSFHSMVDRADEKGLITRKGRTISTTEKGQKLLEQVKTDSHYRFGKAKPIEAPETVSPELGEFLAYLIAEGHEQKVTDGNYRILFTNNNQEFLDRFKQLGEDFFDLDIKQMDQSTLYANSKALEKFLEENGYITGQNSFNKEIPDFIISSGRETASKFLQKYFDCEANVTDQQIDLMTASEEIASALNYMLLRFGIIGRTNEKHKYAANTEEQKVRKYHQVTVSGSKSLQKFRDQIGFSIRYKKESLDSAIKEENTNIDTIPCGEKIRKCRNLMGADRTQVAKHKQSLKAYEDGKYQPSRQKLNQIVRNLDKHLQELTELKSAVEDQPRVDKLEELVEKSGIKWKDLNEELGYSRSDRRFLSYKKFQKKPEKLTAPALKLVHRDHDLAEAREKLKELKALANSDIFWDEIEEIRKVEYSGWVYDLTVQEDHSFTAGSGGILCHNSYSLGTLAEELQTSDISDNLSTIIIDPMGIYWSMKRPNDRAASLLEDWGLNPDAFDANVYIPKGKVGEFEKGEMTYDDTFTLKPSNLTADEWAMAFGFEMNSETGILLERVISKMSENFEDYDIDRILEVIERFDFPDDVKNRLQNRFMSAKEWGVFGEKSSLEEFTNRGQLSIIDVSVFGEMGDGWSVRSLVVGLLAKRILRRRMTARRIEEIDEMEGLNENEMPIVWMMIDEAHEFLPADGQTAASHPLMRWVKIGREPGVSLALATQQPAKLNPDALSQCDVILSHRLTSKEDIDSLGNIMHTYMRHDIQHYIDALPDKKGVGLLLDDNSERIYPIQMRPRKSWHAGGTPDAFED